MVSGLSHITLVVKDLERTTDFLEKIFGAKEIQILSLKQRFELQFTYPRQTRLMKVRDMFRDIFTHFV